LKSSACIANILRYIGWTWDIVNELTSRKQSRPQVKEVKTNGSLVSEPNELSEVFNDHFASIGSKLAEKIPYIGNGGTHLDYLPSPINADNFRLNTTSPLVVGTLLSKLCKSKATGLDKISARLLSDCSDLIADSICAIFNCSINSGTCPNEWKCSKVIPLFKKGERRDLNNYRPISIIPVVAKVFERIIYDQVYAYLMDNKTLYGALTRWGYTKRTLLYMIHTAPS
jgi:hypothetical protein